VLRSLRAEATGAPRSLWVARCVEAGWRRDGGLRLVNARACAHGLVHDGGWRSGRAAARVLAVTPNMTKPSSPSGVRASCCPFLGSDKWALGVVSDWGRCGKACGEAVVLTSEEQGMSRPKPWEVSDELWELIEPLIPQPHRPYGHPGRKRIDDRKTLQGILFVLYTGIQWDFLPQEMGFGSGVTCWRRLREWQEAGVWD